MTGNLEVILPICRSVDVRWGFWKLTGFNR